MGQKDKKYTWDLFAKKLSGEATPDELRELETLLWNNPELHYPMQTIIDMWQDQGAEDKISAEIAFNRHLDRMENLKIGYHYPSSKTSIKRSVFVLSSFFAVLLVFSLLYFRTIYTSFAVTAPIVHKVQPSENEILTATGSKMHQVLPDGTSIWLNSGSRISYSKSFGAYGREVNLTGEAFFDVVSNPNKPFVIHTARIDIKVLGTRFNVKSYPTDKTTETTLIRGSIEVSLKNKSQDKIVLKPDQKLVVSNEDSISLQQSPRRRDVHRAIVPAIVGKPTYERNTGAIIETSWVDNKLIFQDQNFADLAVQMERWYGVTIHFQDRRQKELQFTGTFEKETIQQALEALKLTADFSYSIEGTEITITN
jgi:transmembrane sensor